MTPYYFFAPCPRGLEKILATELEQLGAFSVSISNGGVKFQGSWHTCYRANLESRIASRILWQVGKQPYTTEVDIYRITHLLPWNEWFSPVLTIRVNIAAIKCSLHSINFVTLKIKDAICDKFREITNKRPSIDTVNPDIRVHGFLDAKKFTLYLDTSGDPLFKRNLRKISGIAPLRENLAAGILQLAGWKPGIPLLDPMCGSGTFLLEAAQMSLNIAPGIERNFAFEKFKNFDGVLWRKLRRESVALQKPKLPQPIYGSDLFGKALSDTHTNLSISGLAEVIELKQCNILEISAPVSTGILITNPPYGKRSGEQKELAALYPKLGDILKKKFVGWNAYLFTADTLLPKLIHLATSRRITLFNAALECRLLEYIMVAGEMKRIKRKETTQRLDPTTSVDKICK
jgi:putative N6-adenine-specific DNA methylase